MAAASTHSVDEESSLLRREIEHATLDLGRTNDGSQPERMLPVALLAALAMSSTAATSYYAFTTLICRNPEWCEGHEKSRYAGSIAVTTSVANIAGVLALGHFQETSKNKSELSLVCWLLTRSMSAVMLLIGVATKSIYIALSGRIFEALASDNLLHFVLNLTYARSKDHTRTSSLIAYSLALYLSGVSISPFVAGLFQNFTISFLIALCLFAIAIVYLLVFAAGPRSVWRSDSSTEARIRQNTPTALKRFIRTMLTPLDSFHRYPSTRLVGFALLAYNIVQSYIFNALLVHTSLHFQFTGRENGLLISLVHVVAAVYIMLATYIIPKIKQRLSKQDATQNSSKQFDQNTSRDTALALISLFFGTLSLVGIGFAETPGQIYIFTLMLALSLPASAFIKTTFLAQFVGHERDLGLASLAAMETFGSVLGPMVLGGFQSFCSSEYVVFFAAATLTCISGAMFGLNALLSLSIRT